MIGGGPSGAAASIRLAEAGARVLLVEKESFPRYKVCGCCTNARALRLLQQLGVHEGGTPLHKVRITSGGRSATLQIPGGLAIARERLDEALLHRAASVGVEVRAGLPARLESVDGASMVGLGKEQWRPAAVVLAAGLASRTAAARRHVGPQSHIGAGARIETDGVLPGTGTIHMIHGRDGYVGLARLADGRVNAAAAVDPGGLRGKGGVAGAVAQIAEEAGDGLADVLRAAHWRTTPALTSRLGPAPAPGVFAVGDAAGYIEPFTGEGIAWALADGVEVAEHVLAHIAGDGRAMARWRWHWRRRSAGRKWRCRLVASLLRSPLATQAALAGCRWVPAAVAPLVPGRLHG